MPCQDAESLVRLFCSEVLHPLCDGAYSKTRFFPLMGIGWTVVVGASLVALSRAS